MRSLLKFRHFLRHTFAVELDRSNLVALGHDLRLVDAPVIGAIAAFEGFLRQAGNALNE